MDDIEGRWLESSESQRALLSSTRAFATLAEGNRVVLRASSEEDLLRQMCSTAAKVGGYAFSWYGIPVDDDAKSVEIVASGGDDRGYLDTLRVTWGDDPLGQGPTGLCLKTGRAQVRNDLLSDPKFGPWREAAEEGGIHCSVALPVLLGEKIHGALMVYALEPSAFDSQALELLTSLASNIGYGISRLRAMAALAKSEESFRAIAENASDIVLRGDGRGVIQWISPSVESVLGWAPQQLVGQPLRELIHPDDQASLGEAREASAAGGRVSLNLRLRRPDGTYRWMSASGHLARDHDGVLNGFVSGWRDIQAEVEARNARVAAEQEMAASEARYRLIAENALDVVVQADANGVISWVSPSVTEVLGWDPAELVGRRQKSLVHPDDWAEVMAVQQRLLADGTGAGYVEERYLARDGGWRWVGVHGRALRDEHGAIIGGIDAIRDIDAEVETRQQLAFEVNHDSLTRLWTRDWLLSQMAQPVDGGAGGRSLVCVGVDRLNEINDAFTHTAGDRVLIAVADRIVGSVDGSALVARTADNELSLLLSDPIGRSELVDFIARLQVRAAGSVSMGTQDIPVTVSIGIATDVDSSPIELLRDASTAMHRAKDSGGDRWEFANPHLAEEARQRMLIQTGLRDALAAGQIQAWYQPVVTLPDGRLRGYEALARWIREDGTVVPPDEFIPVAEQTGLIVDLDRSILRQSLKAMTWLPSDLHVAVNLSSAALVLPDLVERVTQELAAAHIPPGRLHLEVTETSLVHVTPSVQTGMRELANLGVHWWVDDFGTGYSSIAHLRDLPVQGLKLDRSFTHEITGADPTSLRLAQGLAGLAQGLGLDTIAEGVETQPEADVLAAQGWELAQGWLFGRPQPLSPPAVEVSGS